MENYELMQLMGITRMQDILKTAQVIRVLRFVMALRTLVPSS